MDDQQTVRSAGVRIDVMAAGCAVLKAPCYDAQDLLRRGHSCTVTHKHAQYSIRHPEHLADEIGEAIAAQVCRWHAAHHAAQLAIK